MVLKNLIKNLSQEIYIPAEIEKWRCEHGFDPKVIVDLKELTRAFAKIDEGGLILGGRFNIINELFGYFFNEIKKWRTNLVFMVSLDEDRFKDINDFPNNFDAFDCIANQQSLKIHLDNVALQNTLTVRPSERILYNLLSLCKEYGDLHVNYGLGKRAMLAYAREYRKDVLSIMTLNTELLSFNDDFQYWSLSEVNFTELKIAFVCRQDVQKALGLDTQQMYLLYAISQLKPTESEQTLVDYVKQHQNEPNEIVLSRDFTRSQYEVIDGHLKELWTLSNYTGTWNEDLYTDAISHLRDNDAGFEVLLQFCKENIPFALKLLNERLTLQRDLLFVDLRASNSKGFIYLMVCMLLKLCGILFHNVIPALRPKTRIVYEDFDEVPIHEERNIFYPDSFGPININTLIVKEDSPHFSRMRWDLLAWCQKLESEFIQMVNGQAPSNHMRVVLFTLEFLKSHNEISAGEADVILFTELEEETKRNANLTMENASAPLPPPSMPNDQYPSYAKMSWVLLAHKYTITFEIICHCLELCGMRRRTSPIWFDAIKFHENMYQAENSEPAI